MPDRTHTVCAFSWHSSTHHRPVWCNHISSCFFPYMNEIQTIKIQTKKCGFVFAASVFIFPFAVCVCATCVTFTCTETQPCSLSCSWIMSTSWLEQSLVNSAVRAFISSMATSTGLSSTCFSPTTSTRFFTYGKVLEAGGTEQTTRQK